MRTTHTFRVVPTVLFSIMSAGMATVAVAQDAPELPAPSPRARVEQRVGLSDFAVEYSSPGVKGRKIWGDLVPYDELWRTGANRSTKLVASSFESFFWMCISRREFRHLLPARGCIGPPHL
jgi:hypothetical protein